MQISLPLYIHYQDKSESEFTSQTRIYCIEISDYIIHFSKKMAEDAGKNSGVSISELTLGEAESFLNSLLCLSEKTNNKGMFFIFKMAQALLQ